MHQKTNRTNAVAATLTSFLVLVAGIVAGALGTYGPPVVVATLSTSAFVDQIAVADFTGDGRREVVIALSRYFTADTPEIVILGAGADSTFTDITTAIFTGPVPRVQHPREIVVADFNGDNRPDFFIADHGDDRAPYPGYRNTLVLSTSDGRLRDATSQLPAIRDFSHSATAADIDQDGDLDLYVGNVFGELQIAPYLLINDGTGQFVANSVLLPASLGSFANGKFTTSLFTDVTNDGLPDLVLGGDDQPSSSLVLVNQGGGRLALHQVLPAKPFAPNASALDIASADVNGDNATDLFIAFTKHGYEGSWVQVLVNTGNGAFRDETPSRLPQSDNVDAWPKFLEATDIDGDADVDLIVLPDSEASPPRIYRNDGSGRFAPVTNVPASLGGKLGLTDLDHDGGRDFVNVRNRDIQTVRQLSGGGPPSPPGRVLAGPGAHAGTALIAWSEAWGATGYQVWRSRLDGSSETLVATTTSRSHLDDSVADGTSYKYWVRATSPLGTSGHSLSHIAVIAPTLLRPPTDLRVASIVGNTVTLHWRAPTNSITSMGYILEGGVAAGQVLGGVPTGSTATSFTFDMPTGVFFLRVHATAGSAKSLASNEIQIFVNVPAPPSAPSNLLGLGNGAMLHLAWVNTTTGGAPTALLLDVSGSVSTSLTLPVTENFSFSGVPGGTYSFVIRALNASGTSAPSNIVTLTFPGRCAVPDPPTQFVATKTGNVIALTWSPPASGTAATGYTLLVSGSFVGSVPTAGRVLTGTVGPGSYSFRIVATNPCGTSVATGPQTLTIP